MNEKINIEVKIEQINKELNQIIFKPYSPEFKHAIDEYPSKAINITSLDPMRDIEGQLLTMSIPYIKETIFKENPERFEKLLENITAQNNPTISREINLEQLFSPETIEPPKMSAQNVLPSSEHSSYMHELTSTDVFTVVV